MRVDPITGQPTESSNQPLSRPVEATRFSNKETRWGVSSNRTDLSTGEQVGNFLFGTGIIGAIGFYGPNFYNNSAEYLNKNNTFKNLNLPKISAPDKPTFWYNAIKRVENTSIFGPYLSGIWNVFAKATYASEALSVFVDRGDLEYTFDISKKALGIQGRLDTLSVLKGEISKFADKAFEKDLANIDYLVFHKGKLYQGFKSKEGKVTRGKQLASGVSLLDRGKYSNAYLAGRYAELGTSVARDTSMRYEKVFGASTYIPIGEKGGFGKKGSVFRYLETANSYFTMGVSRTSTLIKEMYNEFGNLFEYVSPTAKAGIYKEMAKLKLAPRIPHGHSSAMLARYGGMAVKGFMGLAALNQAGYWLQHGNDKERIVGGVMQTAILGYAGKRIAETLKLDSKYGVLAGAGLGLAGMLDMGPFKRGIVPGFAAGVGDLNYIRSSITEAIGFNGIKRWIEQAAPGSTDFTTAVGLGIFGGVGYTLYSKYKNRKNNLNLQNRTSYLESLEWNSLEDLEKHQLRTDPKIVERFNEMDDSIKIKARNEINEYVAELRRDQRWGYYSQAFGTTGDSHHTKSKGLANLLQMRAFEKVKNEIIEEEGHWLQKLGKVINSASGPRSAVYASAVGTAIASLLTFQMATIDTPEEIKAKNRGELFEPVRRGQKWEFGQTHYEGEDILYYRPSWIARAASGAVQAGQSGNRGMLEEFLLKNFTYNLEKEDYWEKPAPITGGAFDQLPFLYPFIKPLADLIKRPKLMHLSEWAAVEGDTILFKERASGMENLPNEELGGLPMTAPVSPYAPSRVWGRWWQEVTSIAGLVGFYQREAKNILTGDPGFGTQRNELGTYSSNLDMISRFYDLHSGGGFLGVPFVSEVIRRFLVKRDTEIKDYNPIANNMPSWMPESLRYGNQYSELRHGEGAYRLPGEGYAALNPELKGVDPEDYPLLHRLKILGDVAHYSSEYRAVRSEALKNLESGMYNSDQARSIYDLITRQERRADKKSYRGTVFEGGQYQRMTGTIREVLPDRMSVRLNEFEGEYSLAGLSNDIGHLIGQMNMSYIEAAKVKKQNEARFLNAVKPGSRISLVVPKSIGHAIDSEGIIGAQMHTFRGNLNREFEYYLASTPSIMGEYASSSFVQKLIGKVWEGGTSFVKEMAKPIEHLGAFGASPISKFFPQSNIVDKYEAEEVYGSQMKLWQKPLSDWFAPAIKSAAHNWLGLDFESPGLKKKRNIDQYFDNLKYYKHKMLESEALASGDESLAAKYRNVSKETILGSEGLVSRSQFVRRLGGAESRFALGFSKNMNPSQQMEILNLLPKHKQRLFQQHLSYLDKEALERSVGIGEAGESYLSELDQFSKDSGFERSKKNINDFNSQRVADEDFASFMRRKTMSNQFTHSKLPKTDWIGFNPAVDLEDVKVKYIQKEGMDFHDFGIYPSKVAMAYRKPYISNEAMSEVSHNTIQDAFKTVGNLMNRKDLSWLSNVRYNIEGPSRSSNRIDIEATEVHPYNIGNF